MMQFKKFQFVLQEWVDFLEGKTDSGFIKKAYKYDA